MEFIEYEDFKKVVMKTGKIIEAEEVPESKKLIKMKVDLGGEIRTLVGGLKGAYSPEELVGKVVIVVANLKPKKLMGIESQGMLLAVEDENGIHLLTPDKETKPGLRVW